MVSIQHEAVLVLRKRAAAALFSKYFRMHARQLPFLACTPYVEPCPRRPCLLPRPHRIPSPTLTPLARGGIYLLVPQIPEMVPFRLTQNMVDCFGISGVEGSYRKCAEITLQVSCAHCRSAPIQSRLALQGARCTQAMCTVYSDLAQHNVPSIVAQSCAVRDGVET